MKAFKVKLDGKEIDKVFYNDNSKETPESVKRSLVDHDGYDPNIVVTKEANKRPPKTKEDSNALFTCNKCGKSMSWKEQSHLVNEPDGEQTWTCQKPNHVAKRNIVATERERNASPRAEGHASLGEHTPTPWYFNEPQSMILDEAKGAIIAKATNRPDGRLIVRAVNSHTELMLELENALLMIKHLKNGSIEPNDKHVVDTINGITRTLAKVEGKGE